LIIILYILGTFDEHFLIADSGQIFANIMSVTREQFSDIFDRVKSANDYSLDQMSAVVSVEKDTIKGFYRGDNIKSETWKR